MTADELPGARVDRPVRRLIRLIGGLRWWIAVAGVLSFVTFAAGIGLISVSAHLISRSALVDSTATLALAIVAVRFFAVVRAVGRYVERYLGHLGTFRILTRIRSWCFRGLEPSAPASLVDRRAGDVLTRIVQDVETLQDLSLRVLAPPIAALLAGSLGAVVLGVIDPALGVVLALFLLSSGVGVPLLTRHAGRAAAEALVIEQAQLNSVAVESVAALADLVAYGREDLLSGRIDDLTVRRRDAERRLANLRGLQVALAGLLGGLAAVSLLALAVRLVTQGRLDGVLLAVVPLAAIATFESVVPLANAYEHLDRSRAAATRLFELVDTEPTVHDPPLVADPPTLSGEGLVEFDDVYFRYVPDGPDVLVGASFVVTPGAQVAIVGPSGAGKSTITSLLLRFWEQQRGAVRIDGVDLRDIPADAARAAVAVVAQHDHLFDTTVRDNLLLGDGDADDTRLLSVLDASALGDLLRAMPGGLDERVGENGRRLSGGERQRLMIARALLAESAVLVLDEATAHLDPGTERMVIEGVARWRAGRTTIHIAHHADGLGAPDLVLRVDGGTVHELHPDGPQQHL